MGLGSGQFTMPINSPIVFKRSRLGHLRQKNQREITGVLNK